MTPLPPCMRKTIPKVPEISLREELRESIICPNVNRRIVTLTGTFQEQEYAMKDLTEQLIQLVHQAGAQGVTCYQLAKASGVSAAQLSNLLNRKRGVSVVTLSRLAEALGYEVRFCKQKRKRS